MKPTHLKAQIISTYALVIASFLIPAASSSSSASSGHTTTTATEAPATKQAITASNATTTTTPSQRPQLAEPNAAANQSATTLRPSGSSGRPILSQNLIGSILLRAANLNSLNHQPIQQQHQQHRYEEDEDSSDSSLTSDECPPSQLSVPTDSGEDPLESTTISLEGNHDDDADDNNNSDQSHSISQQEAPTTLASDPESVAVDSNNVSAVLSSIAAAATNMPLPQDRPTRQNPMACEQAYTQCALRKACAPALKAYSDHCHELISNQTSSCSAKCLEAMIALRSSEEGDDLESCDCQSNEYCLASKQRGLLCKTQVEKALDPKTVVSCSTASSICMADQSCAPALGYYYRNCRPLLSQRHCSASCNNSLAVLHRQPKALKLISCRCDGSEEFPCLKLKTLTERLCLNKDHASSPLLIMEGPANEEESSNLTNNPENLVLGVPALASTDGESAGADGGDDDRDAIGEESSYNGIQMAEDNWIPLISGRFFTNLHHNQQQLHAAQQSKLRHKPKETSQYKQQQQQQQTRRPQRNMRQHRARSTSTTERDIHGNGSSHHEGGKRSRFGRIFMLAASTSSAEPMFASSLMMIFLWSFGLTLIDAIARYARVLSY